MAIYMGARPFGLYNCTYMRDYILTANPANIPPHRRLISGELLIACYEKTKKKVVPRIASESFLNFTTDETSNVRKERVQNLCVVIPQEGAYYVCSEVVNNAASSMSGK